MNEKELLELLMRGDSGAFKYCFNQNHTRLWLLAYRIVNDRDQAKDIVQDVFVRLWRNRAHLQITSSLPSYLSKATINASLNFIGSRRELDRKEARQRELSAALSSNTTEEDIFHRELAQKLTLAIGNLPSRTALVFTLIRFEEMSYKEVAESLHISLKAVEKEMMKAMRLLRAVLP